MIFSERKKPSAGPKNTEWQSILIFTIPDRWADPAHQETPAAWKNLSLDILEDSVYNYTMTVLQYLNGKNLVPEMVQVGNETNNGMLWPVGEG
jgi:arabinogalactan endo-1,4-beta-galactosidase